MIVVLAKLKLKAGSDERFIEAARSLVDASRKEFGVLAYELLSEGEGRYCFLEKYRDEEAVAAHAKSEHYRRIGRQLGEFIDGKPSVERFQAVC